MSRNGRPAHGLASAVAALVALSLALGLAARSASAEEAWDAIYIANHKVGYQHTSVKPLPRKYKDRDLLNVQVNQLTTLRRNNDTLNMQVRLGTIETTDGEVLRLDFRTSASEVEQRNFGDIVDGKFTMTFEAGGRQLVRVIDWPADVRGPYAVEQNFARKPMTPGETRSLKTFLPVINEVCAVALTAETWEPVTLPSGKTLSLLKVVTHVTGPDGHLRTDYDQDFWFDTQGQVMKTHSATLGGVEMFRTTKASAQSPIDRKFDLIAATLIRVSREIPRPEQTREATYRLTTTIKAEDPSTFFPDDRRQTMRRDTSTTATLTVRTAGPEAGTPGPDSVDEMYLRSNALINGEDPVTVRLMKDAVGNETRPWPRAVAIQHWVATNLKEKNYKTGFATSSEVAVNLKGDCTEHSVLTAAMCRAAGIPSRVVTGLLYAKNLGGFGGHMWTEVYVDRRWVAIDSTFDQGDVDATHLKLSDSSLDGINPYDSLLPILSIASKVKIEALEVR